MTEVTIIIKSPSSTEQRRVEKPSGKQAASDPAAAVTHGISHGHDSEQTQEKGLPKHQLAQILRKSRDKDKTLP